jgi:ribosomal protein L37AE/L43A
MWTMYRREAKCPECGFRYAVWDEEEEVWECGSGVCGHVNTSLEPLTIQEIRGE